MSVPNRLCFVRAALLLLAVAGLSLVCAQDRATAAELTQYFPAVPAGQQAPTPRCGWKIRWQVLERGTHNYGGSAVLEIQSVEFMKGYKADGSEDWIKVLNNLAMAEMYVPYHDGSTEFFDITGFSFPFVRARQDFIPPSGTVRATLHEDDYVISEVVDDHVRWMDNNDNNKVRRGQVLNLWATFTAGNYRYVLLYRFGDDGLISVRAGGTAENFFNLQAGQEDHATHIHMPAWRMEFDLGNAEANRIEMIERVIDTSTNRPTTLRRPFNAGREGGETWEPTKFSVLKITSSQTQNRHQPPRNVGYTLKPSRMGTLRNSSRPFTAFDFWVSRLNPDSEARAVQAPELRFIDVPQNVSSPEPIAGKAVVIWYHSSLNHIPRTEDYGAVGYRSTEGVAITAWTGFDLLPVDLWHKTPLHERGGN